MNDKININDFKFTPVKENNKEFAHTNVFYRDIYLGYIIYNKSKYSSHKYTFVSKHKSLNIIHSDEKHLLYFNLLIEIVNKIIWKEN